MDFPQVPIEAMSEPSRCHARDVTYWSGQWDQLQVLVPTFELCDFRAGPDLPPNPHMRTVVRRPRTLFEQPVPVGVVSNTYTLVQHADVAANCFAGIQDAGIDPSSLRCEIGITPLGEWMNLRIYFPDTFRKKVGTRSGDDVIDLRLECFNSVDGSSRLVILFGWLRVVCGNGMVIGETMVELRDIHNQHLSVEPIPETIREGLAKVGQDLQRLREWEETEVNGDRVEPWA